LLALVIHCGVPFFEIINPYGAGNLPGSAFAAHNFRRDSSRNPVAFSF
jgi:hypothetical protein